MNSNSEPDSITMPSSVETAPWKIGEKKYSSAITIRLFRLPIDVKNP